LPEPAVTSEVSYDIEDAESEGTYVFHGSTTTTRILSNF